MDRNDIMIDEKDELLKYRDNIEKDKEGFANKKIQDIDIWLPKLPDRMPKKGNQTMKDYLKKLKKEIEQDKIGFAERKIEEINRGIEEIGD